MVVLLASLLVAGAGIILLLGAAAILVGDWLGAAWRGWLVVGVFALLAGIAGAVVAARSLGRADLRFPATRREIKEDLACFLNERSKTSSPTEDGHAGD